MPILLKSVIKISIKALRCPSAVLPRFGMNQIFSVGVKHCIKSHGFLVISGLFDILMLWVNNTMDITEPILNLHSHFSA